jgi:hypothetical protein
MGYFTSVGTSLPNTECGSRILLPKRTVLVDELTATSRLCGSTSMLSCSLRLHDVKPTAQDLNFLNGIRYARASFTLLALIFLTSLTTSGGNFSLINFGLELFTVGIAAIKIPSSSSRPLWSGTANAENIFQKL